MYRKNLSIFCSNYSSVFVRQAGNISAFDNADSWVILSDIEQRIKQKIEQIGTPLKDWDIHINYGIKTGCNEAFIIDLAKRKELIAQDPKSDEIIRPILRGRDIKRYGYEYADQYLVATFPSKGYKIDDYPAVKNHLLTFGRDLLIENGFAWVAKNYLHEWCFKRLEQTGADIDINGKKISFKNNTKSRKATTNQWFETQDSISYWDDFSKQKIVWGEISDTTKFCIDLNGDFVTEATTFLMTSQSLFFLLGYLNSKLSEYLFSKIGTTTGVGTIRWKKYTIEKLPVPKVSAGRKEKYDTVVKDIIKKQQKKDDFEKQLATLNRLIYQDFQLTSEEIEFIEAQ